MLKEFREFAMRGNVVDMAVGIIIGMAFGVIINSLVADVIMPPIGMLLGKVDFKNLFVTLHAGTAGGSYASLDAAKAAGAVTINYGAFLNTVVNFVIVAFAMFMIITGMNKMKKKQESAPATPTVKECPRCFTTIHLMATRCPNCTSDIKSG